MKQQLTDESEDVFDSVFVDVIISLLADIATASCCSKKIMRRMRISYVRISGTEMSLGTRDTLDPEGLRVETDVRSLRLPYA